MQVGKLALQVHGGIGFTWEHPLHRFLKRTTRLTSAFGDAGWHRESLARCHLDGLSMP
jgi:alkylation response protein AidB-like acyl-CoA dehydrogenase